MGRPPKSSAPERRKGHVQISFWCPEEIVRAVDKMASQLQEEQIARVHRSDVIKQVLAERFGVDLRTLGESE